jgi:hypothetical protein
MMTSPGLDAIKAATWKLHTPAEPSGVLAEILARRATRLGVALVLHNSRERSGHDSKAAAGQNANRRRVAPEENAFGLPVI